MLERSLVVRTSSVSWPPLPTTLGTSSSPRACASSEISSEFNVWSTCGEHQWHPASLSLARSLVCACMCSGSVINRDSNKQRETKLPNQSIRRHPLLPTNTDTDTKLQTRKKTIARERERRASDGVCRGKDGYGGKDAYFFSITRRGGGGADDGGAM